MRTSIFWRIAFLTPPLAVFALIVIWPLADSFFYSFTNWNGFDPRYKFVGLDNFAKVGSDPLFLQAVVNTADLDRRGDPAADTRRPRARLLLDTSVRAASVFKSIFYLPICLSAIVVGQIWTWIYQPDWGLLNTAIGGVTGEAFPFAWLARPLTALGSVIVAWSWQQTGLAMVIFLAGLTAIPHDLVEAADIEGASRWQRIRYVVLPLLRPATVVVVALMVINSLKGFDILYIMTGGGPFNSSDTLAMHMYNEFVQEIPHGLRQRDLGDPVPHHADDHPHLLPPAAQSGRDL